MQKIKACLWFNNKSEEAANYYVSVFQKSKIFEVSRYGDAGPGPKGSALVVTFVLNAADEEDRRRRIEARLRRSPLNLRGFSEGATR